MKKEYKIIFSIMGIFLLIVFLKNEIESIYEKNTDGMIVMAISIIGILLFMNWIIKLKENPTEKN